MTNGALASGHDVTHLLPGVEQVQAGVVDVALLLRRPEQCRPPHPLPQQRGHRGSAAAFVGILSVGVQQQQVVQGDRLAWIDGDGVHSFISGEGRRLARVYRVRAQGRRREAVGHRGGRRAGGVGRVRQVEELRVRRHFALLDLPRWAEVCDERRHHPPLLHHQRWGFEVPVRDHVLVQLLDRLAPDEVRQLSRPAPGGAVLAERRLVDILERRKGAGVRGAAAEGVLDADHSGGGRARQQRHRAAELDARARHRRLTAHTAGLVRESGVHEPCRVRVRTADRARRSWRSRSWARR